MSSRTEKSGLGAVLGLLVSYRMLIYLGGTIAIGTPLFLARAFDVELPQAARTAIVVASLGLMIVTYIGERRLGLPDTQQERSAGTETEQTTAEPESYSLRQRAAVALAVVGVAAAVYLAIEGRPIVGLMFVAGALLFGQVAFGGE